VQGLGRDIGPSRDLIPLNRMPPTAACSIALQICSSAARTGHDAGAGVGAGTVSNTRLAGSKAQLFPPTTSSNQRASITRRWDHRLPHSHVHQTDESVVLAVSCAAACQREKVCCCDEFHAESSHPANSLSPASGLARATPLGFFQGIDTAKSMMSL